MAREYRQHQRNDGPADDAGHDNDSRDLEGPRDAEDAQVQQQDRDLDGRRNQDVRDGVYVEQLQEADSLFGRDGVEWLSES